ncbi:diguanylate cyclase (GGDEF)-like protein [Kineococcus xinjiangensis]|uniref:Diguanylate cyclase (GGDEF)-like protein n=1 Tax=Kineococcus xinjiangensis TaxID=512762 RepID=A0A2S6IV69_9ACTN|nr:EAL domain-containing protein [Kineococcus xinjiangensis]PPK98175.1 diguanylate cyclase (GGDEF)-like protein [Kineococcus xinjiangensis]
MSDVTRVEDLLPDDERRRLDECAREPIHVPGAVQPHGVLLAADPVTHEVLQVSANCSRLLSGPPEVVLGQHLEVVIGKGPSRRLRTGPTAAADDAVSAFRARIDGRGVDVVAHEAGGPLVVEIERSTAASPDRLLADLHAGMRRLSRCETVEELRTAAAQQVRHLTGFERVMVYHFHPDGHGEVVAEDRSGQLEPYLGLHYPASDIPAQARRLYVLQPSRMIVLADEGPAELVTSGPVGGQVPLDLSLAQLRAVSPHHEKFMRNMGIGASLSLPVVHDGQLIGMISCGDRTARHVPHPLRRVCEFLAQQLTARLTGLQETQRLRRRLEVQHLRTRLVEQMVGSDDVAEGLTRGEVTVLDLVPADGAVICLEEEFTALGTTPPQPQVQAVVDRLRSGAGGDLPLVTDALPTDHPELAGLLPAAAGLVLVPFGSDRDYVAWFRREVDQSVDWLGDQSPLNRETPLSPRNSFSAWRQSVSGRCLPWDPVEVSEAEELRRDIDAVLLRRAESRLAHLGLHDALTGLPNRRLLMDRLEHALHRHARGTSVALLFIDLDRFKLVNDSFGHDVGDNLLIHAAHRISQVARATDTVARLGGDEFMVLCEDTDAAVAEAIAQRIVDAFQQPAEVDGRELRITASIGVTLAHQHHRPADLLREADTAMYLAKELGRNRASRFEAGLRYQALRHLDVEQALRRGLEHGELAVHYQPVIDVSTGRLHGAEALLRWNRPGIGPVPPDQFIPLAEETGFIVPLGEWVLGEALHQLGEWKGRNLLPSGFRMAVNLSPQQLGAALLTSVERAIGDNDLSPAELSLEITETTLMSERSNMSEAVHALASLGANLSIDDFGTGYSSLAHLRHLPVHQLKVDRSFVSGTEAGSRDAALIAAVCGLAQEFGLSCVAEGVESAEELQLVADLGCGYAQGFHIGRPTSAAVFAARWMGDQAGSEHPQS